jgi:hypothetical protein
MTKDRLRVYKAIAADGPLIKLRKSDEEEAAEWATGLDVPTVMTLSINASTEAFTGFSGDDIVGIWGYTVGEREVTPWLMCSDLINKHGRVFLRESRLAIQALAQLHPDKLLCNYVFKENLQAKRLLVFLGFVWVHSPGDSKFDFFYLPK